MGVKTSNSAIMKTLNNQEIKMFYKTTQNFNCAIYIIIFIVFLFQIIVAFP